MTRPARSFYLCLAPVTSWKGTSHLFLVKVSRPLLLTFSLSVVLFCFKAFATICIVIMSVVAVFVCQGMLDLNSSGAIFLFL